ncbi:hypothetical protein [Micromonospora globispora]|nr:hypothetical protein [Micromonospora globispora]
MDTAPMAVAADPVRPRRIWYVVAALIAAGGVSAAAALMFLVPLGSDLGQRITPGQPVTVQVPEAGKMVWVRDSGRDVSDLRCEPSQPDTQRLQQWGSASMRQDDLTVTADGERWRALLLVQAKPAGRYTMTCTTSGADGASSLSLGDPPWFFGPRAEALAVVASLVLASLGLVVGAVLAVVVAVRRR